MHLCCVLACLPLFLGAPGAPAPGEDPPADAGGPAVLRLDGEPIPEAELEDWLVRHRGPHLFPVYVRARLIEEETRRQGIAVTAEEIHNRVEAQIRERVRNAFGGREADWLRELTRLGRTERGLRLERAIDQGTLLRLERLLAHDRSIPESTLVRAWERRYGPGGRKPSLRLIHIEIPGTTRRHKVDPEERRRAEAEALARAEAVYSRLAAGEDFERLAREVSEDDRSRLAGGMAPDDFSLGAWPEESVAAIEALSPGEFSTPLAGPRGFWIVQLVGVRETPLASVRDELVRELLEADPSPAEVESFTDELEARAEAEILPAMHLGPEDKGPEDKGPEPRASFRPRDEPVLRVAGSEVTRAEYGRWLRHYRGEDSVPRFALWWKIERLAAEAGIDVSREAVEERVASDRETLIEVNFDGDVEAWRADLAAHGRTEESYRREALLRARSTLLAEALLIRERTIRPEDVRRAWREEYGEDGLRIDVRLIVVRPDPPALEPGMTSEEIKQLVEAAFDEAGEEAEELRERALAGEDFGALARRYSDDEKTAVRGGELEERFRPTQWPTEVADAVLDLAPGEVTEPLRLSNAYLLLQLASRTRTPLEGVAEELERKLLNERPTETELAAFRNVTLQSVEIEILPAFYE